MNKQLLNSFLFHQRGSNQTTNINDIFIEVDLEIQVSARLHLKNKNFPTIIFFHGNGEIVTDYDMIGKEYNNRGINFIIVDYRGYGFSNGEPTSQNILSDSIKVFNYLDRNLDKEYLKKTFIMGRSLGSTCALEISYNLSNKIHGIIIESGFVNEDPLFSLIGIKKEQINFKKEDGFLNEKKIKNYFGPLLVIHAKEDHIIPFKYGELLLTLCPSKNKKLITMHEANHNNILEHNYHNYFNEIELFVYSN